MITLIVARAANGAIGKDNDIPWHCPEDLKMFQRETSGGAIIMGRRTWESLPVKPLKNRMNCVISRDNSVAEHVFGDVADAVRASQAAGYGRIYGIGGERIYRALFPFAHRLMITEVDMTVKDADAFFPAFEENHWLELSRRELAVSPSKFTLRELIRRDVASAENV